MKTHVVVILGIVYSFATASERNSPSPMPRIFDPADSSMVTYDDLWHKMGQVVSEIPDGDLLDFAIEETRLLAPDQTRRRESILSFVIGFELPRRCADNSELFNHVIDVPLLRKIPAYHPRELDRIKYHLITNIERFADTSNIDTVEEMLREVVALPYNSVDVRIAAMKRLTRTTAENARFFVAMASDETQPALVDYAMVRLAEFVKYGHTWHQADSCDIMGGIWRLTQERAAQGYGMYSLLAELDTDDSRHVLRTAFASASHEDRMSIIAALGTTMNLAMTVDLIEILSRDEMSARTTESLLYSIASSNPEVMQALAKSHDRRRIRALLALRKAMGRRATLESVDSRLTTIARSHPDPTVRKETIETLYLCGLMSRKRLEEFLTDEPNETNSSYLAALIGNRGIDHSIHALFKKWSIPCDTLQPKEEER